MIIRGYTPSDAPAISTLRFRAVQQIAPRAYSPAQIKAWLPRPDSVAQTRARCEDGRDVWLAVSDAGYVMGVTDLEADGHVDTLYSDPDFAGRGVGSALLRHVEAVTIERGLVRLYTEASELAAPVFDRCGYTRLHRHEFELRGTLIHNYVMEKTLPPCRP